VETGDRAAAMAALPEGVVDAFVVQGSASACRARLAEYEAADVTSVALMHLSPASTPEERGEHIAGQLAALVDESSPSDR